MICPRWHTEEKGYKVKCFSRPRGRGLSLSRSVSSQFWSLQPVHVSPFSWLQRHCSPFACWPGAAPADVTGLQKTLDWVLLISGPSGQLHRATGRAASAWAVFTSDILASIKGYTLTSFPPWLDFPERTSAPKLGKEYLWSPNFKRLTLGSVPNNKSKTQLKTFYLEWTVWWRQ